jgi:hypothetical protein
MVYIVAMARGGLLELRARDFGWLSGFAPGGGPDKNGPGELIIAERARPEVVLKQTCGKAWS